MGTFDMTVSRSSRLISAAYGQSARESWYARDAVKILIGIRRGMLIEIAKNPQLAADRVEVSLSATIPI